MLMQTMMLMVEKEETLELCKKENTRVYIEEERKDGAIMDAHNGLDDNI